MAELIAKRVDPSEEVARWELEEGTRYVLGRTAYPAEADLMVDCPQRLISKRHVVLTWKEEVLTVRRLTVAKNPVWVRGLDQEFSSFEVKGGESFRVGDTDFIFTAEAEDEPETNVQFEPQHEFSFSSAELRGFRFSDADRRIEILARLPEVIRFADSEEALQQRVLEVLIDGIPRSSGAALVRLVEVEGEHRVVADSTYSTAKDNKPVRYSQRLIQDSIGHRNQSVFHCWYPSPKKDIKEYTCIGDYTWAFCIPIRSEYTPDMGLYVSGNLRPVEVLGPNSNVEETFKGDLKFSELVADIYSSLLARRTLQMRSAYLERFMSPSVLEALINIHTDLETALQHRLADVAVLFCDLRGSSETVEKGASDLESTWNRIRDALDVMTSNIVRLGGVVSDFQGDAAMAFWGWPLPDPDAAVYATRVALNIQSDFANERRKGNPAGSFSFGIGIASGRAIAGKLGTFDQFKVGVFGPPVNLASRLEGLTQYFQVPILLDETTANKLTSSTPTNYGIRRLARIQPAGMSQELVVSELIATQTSSGVIKRGLFRDYALALRAFEQGDWKTAVEGFESLTDDGPSRVLRMYMEQHDDIPPEDWEGVIRFGSKKFYRTPSSRGKKEGA